MLPRKRHGPAGEPRRYSPSTVLAILTGSAFFSHAAADEDYGVMFGAEILERSGEMAVRYCTRPKVDALACLTQEGFVCELVEARGDEVYYCTGKVPKEFVVAGQGVDNGVPGEYTITVRLFNTADGWGGEVISVEKAKQ